MNQSLGGAPAPHSGDRLPVPNLERRRHLRFVVQAQAAAARGAAQRLLPLLQPPALIAVPDPAGQRLQRLHPLGGEQAPPVGGALALAPLAELRAAGQVGPPVLVDVLLQQVEQPAPARAGCLDQTGLQALQVDVGGQLERTRGDDRSPVLAPRRDGCRTNWSSSAANRSSRLRSARSTFHTPA